MCFLNIIFRIFINIISFFLAMSTSPSVQQRAQQELDSVVGKVRLPTMEDIANLPYIQAIVKEMLRWMPAIPLDLPHSSMEDDEYQGYFIPAGTVLIAVSHLPRLTCSYRD